MSPCCPPGLGCNSPRHDEPCVLDLCREISGREPAAAGALERWEEWRDAVEGGCACTESRFLRRAYERAREGTMGVLVMELARERRRTPQRRRAGRRAGAASVSMRRRAGRAG
jgi:hypothetical protein